MADNETIHYNSTMPLTTFKSQGEGECGKTGYISGYPGVVNCKRCKVIADKERSTTFLSVKNQLSS